jgi:sensor histidine kinase regulating citrate/malate metabolism
MSEIDGVCGELVRLLRLQRHDFFNHIQVIRALVQLGKTERALNYIDNMANDKSMLTETLQQHVKRSDCREE